MQMRRHKIINSVSWWNVKHVQIFYSNIKLIILLLLHFIQFILTHAKKFFVTICKHNRSKFLASSFD